MTDVKGIDLNPRSSRRGHTWRALLVVLTGAVGSASAAELEGLDRSAPLVKLGDEVVTVGEFLQTDSTMREFLGYGTVSREELEAAIDQFLLTRLLAREARERGLAELPEVRVRVDAILSTAYLKTRLPHSVLDATQEDLETYYEAHKDDFRAERKVRFAHVLASSEARALDARHAIMQGLSFEDAAKDSLDPATAKRGGDVGWLSARRLPAPLGESLLTLEPGQVSQPVQSDFGYHLLKVLEWEPIAYRSLSEVQTIIRDRVLAEKEQAIMSGVRREILDKYRPELHVDAIGKFLHVKQSQVVSEGSKESAANPPGPRLQLFTNAVYPDLAGSAAVTLELLVANLGDEPLEVKKVHSTCRCLQGVVRPQTLAPGAFGTLEITLRAEGLDKMGAKPLKMAIATNDAREKLKMLQVFMVVPPSPSAGIAGREVVAARVD